MTATTLVHAQHVGGVEVVHAVGDEAHLDLGFGQGFHLLVERGVVQFLQQQRGVAVEEDLVPVLGQGLDDRPGGDGADGAHGRRVAEGHLGEVLAARVPGLGQELLGLAGVVVGVLLQRLVDGEGVAVHQVPIGGGGQRRQQGADKGVAVAGVGEGLAHLQVVEGLRLGLEEDVVDAEVDRVEVRRQLVDPRGRLGDGQVGLRQGDVRVVVDGAGLQERQVVGAADLGDLVLDGRAEPGVVLRVGLEHHVGRRVERLEEVGAHGDDSGRVGVVHAIAVLGQARRRQRHRVEHGVGHEGHRPFGSDNEGVLVGAHAHADGVDGCLARHRLGVVLDDARPVPDKVPGVLGVGRVAERLYEVVGGQLVAVAPHDPRRDVELPRRGRGLLPAVSDTRHDLVGVVDAHQWRGEVVGQRGPGVDGLIEVESPVDGPDRVPVVHEELVGRRGHVGEARRTGRGQCPAKRSRSQQLPADFGAPRQGRRERSCPAGHHELPAAHVRQHPGTRRLLGPAVRWSQFSHYWPPFLFIG